MQVQAEEKLVRAVTVDRHAKRWASTVGLKCLGLTFAKQRNKVQVGRSRRRTSRDLEKIMHELSYASMQWRGDNDDERGKVGCLHSLRREVRW